MICELCQLITSGDGCSFLYVIIEWIVRGCFYNFKALERKYTFKSS